MNKIILLGTRQLMTDDLIASNRDYALMLIASRYSKEEMDDEPGFYKYKLKVERIDSIMDLKESKPIDFERGKTPSQRLRWLTIEKLGEENYPNFIQYIMSRIDELTDDFISKLK